MSEASPDSLLISQPIKIGSLRLPNRIVKAAMVENMANEQGEVTEKLIKFYQKQAQGGAGLLITGGAYVQRNGRSVRYLIGVYDDSLIPGLSHLAEEVHKLGAKIVLQIYHCGRQTQPELVNGDVIAPSSVKDRLTGIIPRAMTEREIEETIRAFALGARRAKSAGFDGVEVLAGHGYLISQFLARRTNKRTDQWGGDLPARSRFLFEIIKAIRQEVGRDFPLLVKINSEDQIKDGFNVEECGWVVERLEELGVDAIKLTGGTFESGLNISRGDIPEEEVLEGIRGFKRFRYKLIIRAMRKRFQFQEAYFLENARKIKPKIKIPLILVGGIRTPQIMEEILREGSADLVALGRPLIRQPNFPKKILNGDTSPASCLNCNRCFILIAREKPLRCYAQDKAKSQR